MERPDSQYTFVCTICDLTLDQLPSDALEIARAPNSRIAMYQFGGTQHAIKKVRKEAAKTRRGEVMTTYEKDKDSVAEREQRGRNLSALRAWLQSAHPEIRQCTANDKAFAAYFDQSWSDADLSVADFEFALANIDIALAKQHVPTVAEENARRRAMSLPELQHLAREERPVPQPDALPQFYIPIGKKKEVELTAEVLRRAGTRTGEITTADLKFLIRRYTAAEVNARLGVKPTVQPGQIVRVKIQD